MNLPPLSALESIRTAWRRELADEESRVTPNWIHVAELLFPHSAATIALHESPTRLSIEAA